MRNIEEIKITFEREVHGDPLRDVDRVSVRVRTEKEDYGKYVEVPEGCDGMDVYAMMITVSMIIGEIMSENCLNYEKKGDRYQ